MECTVKRAGTVICLFPRLTTLQEQIIRETKQDFACVGEQHCAPSLLAPPSFVTMDLKDISAVADQKQKTELYREALNTLIENADPQHCMDFVDHSAVLLLCYVLYTNTEIVVCVMFRMVLLFRTSRKHVCDATLCYECSLALIASVRNTMNLFNEFHDDAMFELVNIEISP